jgi:hypothetical protein
MADSTTSVETREQKRLRMAALGYVPAARPGKCCLCGKGIGEGQYIGKMPDGWQPRSRQRWAHRRCREALREQVRQKAVALGTAASAGSRP